MCGEWWQALNVWHPDALPAHLAVQRLHAPTVKSEVVCSKPVRNLKERPLMLPAVSLCAQALSDQRMFASYVLVLDRRTGSDTCSHVEPEECCSC